MDPCKNKRLLGKASHAMGINVDPLASPFELYDIVICRRKMQRPNPTKTPPQQQDKTLDEATFKTEELQRMRASFGGGMVDDLAFVAEIDQRWKVVRGTKLAAYGDAFIFVEQDTACNKELMAIFEADGCRVILRERAGVYFASSQGGGTQSATKTAATVPAAPKPADMAAREPADKADGAAPPDVEPAPEPTAEKKQKLLADAAERRVKDSSAAVTSSQVEPPIASSEVAETPAPNLEALAALLAGKEMTEGERAEIVAPLMQSLQKIMPNAMQASAVKQFVEWMHSKIGADSLLDLVTHSEPVRVEEYKARIKMWPVDANVFE